MLVSFYQKRKFYQKNNCQQSTAWSCLFFVLRRTNEPYFAIITRLIICKHNEKETSWV